MDPARIIIRGPNWVGDAVLSVPALKAVRDRFPESEITLWVRPWVGGLFRSASFVDHLWIDSERSAGRWLQAALELKKRRFDMGLLLPNSFGSAFSMFVGRVPDRVGYRTDSRGFLLTRPVSTPPGPIHQADYYLELVNRLFGRAPAPAVDLTASAEQMQSAFSLLAASRIDPDAGFAVLCPGAAFGSAKRWHPGRFASLGDRIAREMGLQVVIIGSEAERPIGDQVASFMNETQAMLSGRTDLETLQGLLAAASVVVSNDSGPMHMAAALGTPTVAVFGATDPDATRPLGPKTCIIRHEVPCSPCMLKECPIDHRCMDAIQVDEVFEAVHTLSRRTADPVSNEHE